MTTHLISRWDRAGDTDDALQLAKEAVDSAREPRGTKEQLAAAQCMLGRCQHAKGDAQAAQAAYATV